MAANQCWVPNPGGRDDAPKRFPRLLCPLSSAAYGGSNAVGIGNIAGPKSRCIAQLLSKGASLALVHVQNGDIPAILAHILSAGATKAGSTG